MISDFGDYGSLCGMMDTIHRGCSLRHFDQVAQVSLLGVHTTPHVGVGIDRDESGEHFVVHLVVPLSKPDQVTELIRIAFTIKSGEVVSEGGLKAVPAMVRPLIKRSTQSLILWAAWLVARRRPDRRWRQPCLVRHARTPREWVQACQIVEPETGSVASTITRPTTHRGASRQDRMGRPLGGLVRQSRCYGPQHHSTA